jgi:hypothetical protein
MKAFRVVALTVAGSQALEAKRLQEVKLPYVITRNADGKATDITFTLTGRLKLFVKETDIKPIMGMILKLFGAYEDVDYQLEFIR